MRTRWTESLIEQRLRDAVAALAVSRMPTANELRSLPGGNALACKVSRTCNGFDGWADRLGLERAEHASRKGWRWEEWIAEQAEARGMNVERRRRVKEPWDLLINGRAVDVKVSRPYKNSTGTFQWTFRIEREDLRRYFYILVAQQIEGPPRIYIVPHQFMPCTCATIGVRSKYSRWLNRWDLLEVSC